MTVAGRLLLGWRFDPTVLAGLALLVAGYVWLTRRAGWPNRDARFGLLLALTFLAFESPLDVLGDRYLFSAHMAQHMVLVLAVAPLLAVCFEPAQRFVPKWLTAPLPAFLLFNADLWLWHAPALFEATLHNEALHVAEHLTFVATGMLFWWVAFDLARPVLFRMAYLFLAATASSLLGAVITFSPAALYPSYQLALESPGLGRELELAWGLTAAADQQLGGLLMWVPGGAIFLGFIVAAFIRWTGSQPKEHAILAE